jgi:hypothetical protein
MLNPIEFVWLYGSALWWSAVESLTLGTTDNS